MIQISLRAPPFVPPHEAAVTPELAGDEMALYTQNLPERSQGLPTEIAMPEPLPVFFFNIPGSFKSEKPKYNYIVVHFKH